MTGKIFLLLKLFNNKSAFHLFVSDKKDSKKDKYIGQVESAEFARLFASSYNMYRFMKLLRDSAEYDEKTSGVFKMVCKILEEIEGNHERKLKALPILRES